MKCYERMVCCVPLSPCFMPEGTRAGGKGVLVQAVPPHMGLFICLTMAWQDTLDLRTIDSAARDSARHPCAQNLDLIPKVCPPSLFYATYIGPCHNKAVIEQYR
jgi:hypothetical protein